MYQKSIKYQTPKSTMVNDPVIPAPAPVPIVVPVPPAPAPNDEDYRDYFYS